MIKNPGVDWQWCSCENLQWYMVKWLLAPFFPFILLVVKIGSLFNNGKEWKKLDEALTMVGNDVVRFCQLVLQLYVIFTKANRWPSIVQRINLVKGVLAASAEKADGSTKSTSFFCLFGRIFYAGSTALIFTIIRFYFLIPFEIIFLSLAVLFHHFQEPRGLGKKQRKDKNHEAFHFTLGALKFILFIVFLIVIAFLVNLAPETRIWINPEICIGGMIFPANSFLIKELFIVNLDKSYCNFNFLLIAFIVCGCLRFSMLCYSYVYDMKKDVPDEPLTNGFHQPAPLAYIDDI